MEKPTMKALKRYKAIWSFQPIREDELVLEQGDHVVVAEEYNDKWMRGMKLNTKEIGFFPSDYVKPIQSPIYSFQTCAGNLKMNQIDMNFAASDPARRAKIVLELFTTELEYCERIKLLHEQFVIPLNQFSLLEPEDYTILFSRVAPILSLSEEFTVQLHSRTEAWKEATTQIGDLFISKEMQLHDLFISYSAQHALGQKVMERLLTKEKYKNWITKKEHDCPWTLNSLMIEPVQRILRYKMLLDDLVKATSKRHVDYENLLIAKDIIDEVARACDEATKKMQAELKLLILDKQFPDDNLKLIKKRHKQHKKSTFKRPTSILVAEMEVPDEPITVFEDFTDYTSFFHSKIECREVVREGTIKHGKHNFSDVSDYYLFLLTDVILVAQPRSQKKKTFRLKDKSLILQTWVTDQFFEGNIPENSFVLGTCNDIHYLVAQSAINKNLWFDHIRKLIITQKRLLTELLSHLTIPDEVFYTRTTKVVIPYLGMGQEELTLGRDDLVKVVGYLDNSSHWKAGLYSQKELFDPGEEWYFGFSCSANNTNCGFFPKGCVKDAFEKPKATDETTKLPVSLVFQIRKKFEQKCSISLPADPDRMATIVTEEGTSHMVSICSDTTVQGIASQLYPDSDDMQWYLTEKSDDGSVNNVLDKNKDLTRIYDFWGKMKGHMTLHLKQGNMQDKLI